jgi:hypothetical protein
MRNGVELLALIHRTRDPRLLLNPSSPATRLGVEL